MFGKLKKRLILLYGFTASIILTLVIIGVFFLTYDQNKKQKQLMFQKMWSRYLIRFNRQEL